MKPITPVTSINTQTHAETSTSDRALLEAAKKLETTFLTEMLKSAGMGQARDAFGGGAGEDQFSSFLLEAQAEKIVDSGGLGLTETLFESLKEHQNDNS